MNTFNTSKIELAESVREFKDSAQATLSSLSPIDRLRQFRNKSPRFDPSIWSKLVNAGWSSILVSEELGGLGLDIEHACAIAAAIGQHPLPEPFTAIAIQSVTVLNSLQKGAQRDQLLSDISSGKLMVGLGWQESVGQVEPTEVLNTHAIQTLDSYILNGKKLWVTPGTGANGWLISAMEDSNIGLWWVPADSSTITLQEIDRIDGSSFATITLENTRIPKAFKLGSGEIALKAIRNGMEFARLAQSAELLGLAKHAFDTTLEYLKTRVQFGKPIGSNQALQHKMVDAFIQIELASACLSEALAQVLEKPEELLLLASRAKARCAQVALNVTRLGIQLHGAIGFTDEYDLGLYLKRAIQLNSWLGSIDKMRARYHQESIRDYSNKKFSSHKETISNFNIKDWNQLSESEFRNLVRHFLELNYPSHLRHPSHRLHLHECKDWYLTLSKHGWIAPSWPKEYGGMGLPSDKLLAFIEEMEDYGVCRLPDQGIINLGPVLIQFGNSEQKAYYLPKILSGEHIWCQGYSEPNAGSDLASLKTEAILDGNEFIVNGQKIWTTLAQDATHMFALVRTNKEGKKQAGISFLLIDLSTPGITIRPIKNIALEEEFCEVFFDSVRVPKANIVGELNSGWTIAKALLGFERLFVGSPKTPQYALQLLSSIAHSRGLFEKESFLAQYIKLELDVMDLKALYGTFAEIVKRGETLPGSVSILKIFATETYTDITRFLIEVCEEDGGTLGDIELDQKSINITSPMFNAIITTIYAGTNEIQRNILAKSVLHLPT
jgi:alkylation response protein AidB-like acyl-CoA dehydrogenase